MFNDFIDELTRKLASPLPGREAQYRMAPLERRMMKEFMPPGVTPRIGSVMILFYPSEGRVKTILMKRPEQNVSHAGQISFPGGKFEESDPSLEFTALRETEEETGALASSIVVAGKLSDLYIPPSNFHVHPFVGYTPLKPEFKPDPQEVAALIEVDVYELLHEDNVRSMYRFNRTLGKEVETPYIGIQGETVWGATAMMISELREILKK